MRRLLALWLVLCGVTFAVAQILSVPPGQWTQRNATTGGGFVAGCTESSNWIARTTGMSDADKTKYDALICGLVTDSLFAKLDFFYVLAAPDAATAALNIISTSFSITLSGVPTFAAYQGYTGNGSTTYLITGAATNTVTQYTTNSATMGLWSLTNLANGAGRSYDMGHSQSNGTNGDGYISRSQSSSTRMVARIIDSTSCCETVNGYYPGLAGWSRTGASAWQAYAQGSATAESGTDAAQTLGSRAISILRADSGLFGANQIAIAFIGSSFTGTNWTNMYSRTHTYLVAQGCGC